MLLDKLKKVAVREILQTSTVGLASSSATSADDGLVSTRRPVFTNAFHLAL
jgi:hypothetical protein